MNEGELMTCKYCGDISEEICKANKRTLIELLKEMKLSPEMTLFLKQHEDLKVE